MAAADYQDPSAVDPSAATPAAATAPVKTPGSQIASWYQQYLGRTPENQGVVDAWSGQDAQTAQTGIENSPEAQAYRSAHPAAPGAPTMPNGGTLTQPNFSTSAGPLASATGTNPALSELRSLLMAKATQPENIDPNDPIVQRQTDAYAADQTRAGRNFLTKNAEAAGPYGGSGAETRHAAEVVGRNTGNYRGDLLQKLSDARRTQIAQALSGLGGTLSQDEATRLRQEDQSLAEKQYGAGTAQQAFQDQYQTIFG